MVGDEGLEPPAPGVPTPVDFLPGGDQLVRVLAHQREERVLLGGEWRHAWRRPGRPPRLPASASTRLRSHRGLRLTAALRNAASVFSPSEPVVLAIRFDLLDGRIKRTFNSFKGRLKEPMT